MRGALAVVTALTICVGCQDLHGVEVIVQPGDPAVTSVRLFVGAGGSTNSSLTTSSKVQVDDVEYWSRDVGNETDVVTGVDGMGEVKFLFDTSDAIPVVIAVGYDANHAPISAGALTDLELQDSGGFTGYELPLMGPVAALGQQAATVQLGLWSPDLATTAFDAACAGIVVAGADHPYFVVTNNDQDCDGLTDDDTAHECTPDAYLGTRDADPSETSCLVSDHTTSGVAQCRLGGATCTDNVPRNQNTCVAGHTCTLVGLCALCGTSFDCAADAGATIPMVDHYECALPRKADNSICQTTFTLERPPTGGYGCKSLEIGDASTALGTALTVGNVELDATLQDTSISSCAGKLMAKISSNAMADFTGLVSFTLKNNAGVAVPIHVTMGTSTGTSCPATTDCTLVAGSTAPIVGEAYQPPLTSCAAAWNPPAVIAGLFGGNAGTADPTLSADQLEMIYAANGGLYRTTRTTLGGAWATSTLLDLGGLVVPVEVTLHAPKLSPDGLQLFFAMVDPMAGTTTMYYATRSAATATGWNQAMPVINSDGTITAVSIGFGPSTHVVVGTTSMAGPTAIYDATFDPTTKTLTNFMMIKAGGSNPYLTADGMNLYFDAMVTGGATALFVASRRSPTEAFAPEVQLVELGTGDSVDSSPWVPSGAHTIYYASQRSGATVPSLYTAQRVSF